MKSLHDDLAFFARLINALRPWLGQVVIAGGWAQRLHRVHPLARALEYPSLLTRDADVALDPAVAPHGDEIRTSLETAGFTGEFLGENRQPPITQYRLGDRSSTSYAEFLVPLVGSGIRRNGQPDITVSVGGVSAQKLRHLDVLLLVPWSITLTPSSAVPVSPPATVRMPNPVTYIVQKLLIHGRRKTTDEQAKDLLYIHDTLQTFGGALPELNAIWRADVKPHFHKNQIREVSQVITATLGSLTDTVRQAVVEARGAGRKLSSDQLAETCRLGLGRILAD
jgi:hypothetical protein